MTAFGFIIYIIGVVHSVAEDLNDSEMGARRDPSDKAIMTAMALLWPVTRLIFIVNVIRRKIF